MKLTEIKKEIDKIGVARINTSKLESIENGIKCFKDILTQMLSKKKEELQWEPIESTVKFMVEWTYLLGDEINFNKGFILKGLTGRGKTFLFKAWQYFLQVDNLGYIENGKGKAIMPLIINVKKIAGDYQHPETGGYIVLERYGKASCLMLDDIGKEDDFSRSYGNKVNIIEEIINIREENELLTFATTNENDLSELYDDRTVSRMNKLFTAVPINHKIDFRIK